MAIENPISTMPRALWGAAALIVVAALWMLMAPALGHMGPPWPCVIAGAILLACVAMLMYRPARHVGWGVIVVAISAAVLLMGSGGVIPGLLGAIGGVAAIVTLVSKAPN